MSGVGMDAVKRLREDTGAKIADCLKALQEAGGDFDVARDILRKKGLAGAVSKSSRETASGTVCIASSDGFTCMYRLSCETDFVSMNGQFLDLLQSIAGAILQKGSSNVEDLLAIALPSGNTVDEEIKLTITATGENINIDPEIVLVPHLPHQIIGQYVHREHRKNMGKVGVVVVLESDGSNEKIKGLADELAMQVAAMKPLALDRDRLDPKVIDSERDIQMAKASSSGKPAHIVENMVKGSMEKFFKTVTLVDQPFVIGNDTDNASVKEYVNKFANSIGCKIKIVNFNMCAVG